MLSTKRFSLLWSCSQPNSYISNIGFVENNNFHDHPYVSSQVSTFTIVHWFFIVIWSFYAWFCLSKKSSSGWPSYCSHCCFPKKAHIPLSLVLTKISLHLFITCPESLNHLTIMVLCSPHCLLSLFLLLTHMFKKKKKKLFRDILWIKSWMPW